MGVVRVGNAADRLLIYAKDMRERASYNVDSSFELYQARMAQVQTADFVSRIRVLLEEVR